MVVNAKVNNSRIVEKKHESALSLPTTLMVGYIFVQTGELKVICEKEGGNIHLSKGDFAKHTSGHYVISHSEKSKWISMWLYEDFPEDIKSKIHMENSIQ